MSLRKYILSWFQKTKRTTRLSSQFSRILEFGQPSWHDPFLLTLLHNDIESDIGLADLNKKHLKNVRPIRHCEPPHAHSPGVASGTVARRLRINVHDDNDGQRLRRRRQRQRQRVTEGTAMAP